MKYKLCSGLLLCAAVLSAAAAIFLPPYLSRLADRRLDSVEYAVRAEALDVSLVYRMTTAERLALMARTGGDDAVILPDLQPAQNELTLEQALTVCQEELDALYQAGGLPAPFQVQSLVEASSSYSVICDRDNPQRSLSLWMLELRSDDHSFYSANVIMDAETGLIYGIYLPYHASLEYSISPRDIMAGWGDYLSLNTPDLTDIPEKFPHILFDANDSTHYVEASPSPFTDWIEYQTDEGISVTFSLHLGFEAYGVQETWQALVILPYPME